MLSNLESRVCVVTKLTLCPGRGEPSSARYSVFIGALRFCFTGDELGIETTTSQPLLRRLLCPREWKGKGTGCAVTTVGGWESSWVRPPPSCLLQRRIRCPPPRGSWPCRVGTAVRVQGSLLGTLLLDFPRTIWASFPTLPFLFLLSSLLPASPFFQSLFFLLFLYSDYQTQG